MSVDFVCKYVDVLTMKFINKWIDLLEYFWTKAIYSIKDNRKILIFYYLFEMSWKATEIYFNLPQCQHMISQYKLRIFHNIVRWTRMLWPTDQWTTTVIPWWLIHLYGLNWFSSTIVKCAWFPVIRSTKVIQGTPRSEKYWKNRFSIHFSIMNKVFVILSVLATVSLVSVFHENESIEIV